MYSCFIPQLTLSLPLTPKGKPREAHQRALNGLRAARGEAHRLCRVYPVEDVGAHFFIYFRGFNILARSDYFVCICIVCLCHIFLFNKIYAFYFILYYYLFHSFYVSPPSRPFNSPLQVTNATRVTAKFQAHFVEGVNNGLTEPK